MIGELRGSVEFDLETVDIGGVPELEARYRELLPAVEIDGELGFTYHVNREAFLRRVSRSQREGGH